MLLLAMHVEIVSLVRGIRYDLAIFCPFIHVDLALVHARILPRFRSVSELRITANCSSSRLASTSQDEEHIFNHTSNSKGSCPWFLA